MGARPGWLVVAACLIAVCMVLEGCGGGEKNKTEGEGEEVAYHEDMEELEGLSLPEVYPPDLPKWPQAELELVDEPDPGKTWHFEWASRLGFAEAVGRLKGNLEKNGWSIGEQTGSVEMEAVVLRAMKDQREVLYDLRPDERDMDDFSGTYPVTWIRLDYYPHGIEEEGY